MRFKPGWRYRAVVQGEGEFEGVLGGPAGVDVWPEGGGEVQMKRWYLRLDGGEEISVEEASLGPIEPRGLGRQPGPTRCPACEGRGTRPRPQGTSMQRCGSCSGEGVVYPDG